MRRRITLLIAGLIGTVFLISLGAWQVQRLQWKNGILAEIDARIHDAPVSVPAHPDPVADRYLPVAATGMVTDQELHVLASARGQGPGYRIVSVFVTDDGRRLMLDRGFVAISAKDDLRPPHSARVVANLHWPDETDSYTPEADLAANIWFARDVAVMAQALETEPVFMVLRDTSFDSPRVTPWPVDSSGIPNDHLEYAITWFSFAVIWVVGIGILLWRKPKPKNERPN